MNYYYKMIMNNKLKHFRESETCLIVILLLHIHHRYFVSKNSFIKNYNEFKNEVCIGCLLWQRRYF